MAAGKAHLLRGDFLEPRAFANSGEPGNATGFNDEPWAHCARDRSGQLRRVLDIANRTVRHERVGVQRNLSVQTDRPKVKGMSCYHGTMAMCVAAVSIALFLARSRALMLFSPFRTSDNLCILRKAEHRLRKED
jgi:hypothetical protein